MEGTPCGSKQCRNPRRSGVSAAGPASYRSPNGLTLMPLGRLRLGHLVRVDDEFLQVRRTERSGYRHVNGVLTAGHQYAADARGVVPGVEREPLAIEVRLEPTAEVH